MNTAQDLKEKRIAMRLSLWVGFGMFAIKSYAYYVTNSSAILSDAAESVVHVAAVAFAAYSLRLSLKPADTEHPFGHSKISFISAGFEGAMITIAAIFIIYESISKWLSGLSLQNLDTGMWLTAAALIINAFLGSYLILVGKRKKSLILRANGQHVLTDAWTSFGVLIGVVLTYFTGRLPLDPICAIIVALQILYTGIGLVKESVNGLMDTADPIIDESVSQVLESASKEFDLLYHDLKHINTGDGHRLEVHLLFEDSLTIQEAHRTATVVENRLRDAIDGPSHIITHLEPRHDHESQHGSDHD